MYSFFFYKIIYLARVCHYHDHWFCPCLCNNTDAANINGRYFRLFFSFFFLAEKDYQ